MFVEITTQQINDIVSKLIDGSIDLGGRILAALIIFFIGKYLINWANKLFAKMLQNKKLSVVTTTL